MDVSIENTWKELINSVFHAPLYHILFELGLILGIIWLFFKTSYKPIDHIKLSKAEENELIREWTPEPLVPRDWEPPANVLKAFNRTAISSLGKYVVLEEAPNNKCLNAASFNFLNFIGDPLISDVAIKTLRKYGVGSCGPRGFYGTMDVHIQLEEQLAAFMGCEEAVVYSYGFSTIASAIPAYAKRTDIIFADEGICFAIQKGLDASRSKVVYFHHNDMDHLERLLQKQASEDLKDPKKARVTRRFIIVEGLYVNHGDICPLSELIDLKFKYKVRLFIDESWSFGVLGRTGRGVTEHFGLPVDHVDQISSSLENAIGSCGGFCVGTKYVIDHQRLSGQGYCFSASLPPLLVTSASCAIDKLKQEDGSRCLRLKQVCERVHMNLTSSANQKLWRVEGNSICPLKHLRLVKGNSLHSLESIVDKAIQQNLLLTVARYLENEEHHVFEPSIRLSLNCDFTKEEIISLCDTLGQLAKDAININDQ